MQVMTENKVMPKLRFGEFQDDWETNKLNNIFTISAGGDITKENVSKVKTETFKYPIYANAKEGKGFYAYSDIYKIDSNVVTVAGRGVYLGIAHSRKERFFPIVRLLVLKPKYECDIDYFEHRINLIRLFIESTGVPQLTAPQISNYSVSFPSLPEQQKIASFLSAVDEKLQQLTTKKELLEKYKKGVMQKVFSKELRFKDEFGNNYPDWEEKMLGEVISEIEDGGTPSTSKEEYFGGNVNWVVINDIKDVIYQTLNTLTDEGLKKCSSKLWQPETIILSTGATIGRVGIAKVQTATKQGICGIVTNEFILNTFLKYWFVKNIQLLHRFAQGSSFKEIRPKTIKKLSLNLPSIQEQQKIANFLSSLDSKIELVSTQIENTQSFKKGLLQQMFV